MNIHGHFAFLRGGEGMIACVSVLGVFLSVLSCMFFSWPSPGHTILSSSFIDGGLICYSYFDPEFFWAAAGVGRVASGFHQRLAAYVIQIVFVFGLEKVVTTDHWQA